MTGPLPCPRDRGSCDGVSRGWRPRGARDRGRVPGALEVPSPQRGRPLDACADGGARPLGRRLDPRRVCGARGRCHGGDGTPGRRPAACRPTKPWGRTTSDTGCNANARGASSREQPTHRRAAREHPGGWVTNPPSPPGEINREVGHAIAVRWVTDRAPLKSHHPHRAPRRRGRGRGLGPLTLRLRGLVPRRDRAAGPADPLLHREPPLSLMAVITSIAVHRSRERWDRRCEEQPFLPRSHGLLGTRLHASETSTPSGAATLEDLWGESALLAMGAVR